MNFHKSYKDHRRLFVVAGFTFLSVISAGTRAEISSQSFPEKPIKIIVPFATGGPVDSLARLFGDALGRELKATVIIENKGGAGGTIGTQQLASAPPDGYTLLFATTGVMSINPNLYTNMRTVINRVQPIAMLVRSSYILMVSADGPYKTVESLVQDAKANPGKLSFASSGVGGNIHMTGELFKHRARIDVVHIPYKGTNPATIDVIGRRVTYLFDGLATALPNVRTGKVRPLAVTSTKRLAVLPNVPTLAESMIPGFESVSWYGIVAPQGLPYDISEKINKAAKATLKDERIKAALFDMNLQAAYEGPLEFATSIKKDDVSFGRTIEEAGIKLE